MSKDAKFKNDFRVHPEAKPGTFEHSVNRAYDHILAWAKAYALQPDFTDGAFGDNSQKQYNERYQKGIMDMLIALANVNHPPIGDVPDPLDIILTREFLDSPAGKRYLNPMIMREYSTGRFKFGYIRSRHHKWTDKSRDVLVTASVPLTIRGYRVGAQWLKSELELEQAAALDVNDERYDLLGDDEKLAYRDVQVNRRGWSTFKGMREVVKIWPG